MNEEERKKEIADWYPLVDLVVNKFLKAHTFKELKQHKGDITGAATEGLIDGVESYDEEKGTEKATWYSIKMRSKIMHFIRDFEGYGNKYRTLSIESLTDETSGELEELTYEQEMDVDFRPPRNISIEAFEKTKEEEEYELIDNYEPEGEVDKAIYHQVLMGEATHREIADQFGLTKKSVRDRKQYLVKKLRKQMEQDKVLEDRNAN